MNIVMTGGSGFIGSRLAKRMGGEGHHVKVLDLKPQADGKAIEAVQVDILDPKACLEHSRGAEVMVHLAGPVVEMCRKNPAGATLLQSQGTVNILEACRQNGIPRILFASSFYVYDGIDERQIVNEDTPLDLFKMELFGAAKLASEQILKVYAAKYKLKYAILRFGSAYGWGNCSNVIKTFLEMGFRKQPIEVWGKGFRRNQYTYVDDIVEGCMLALKVDGDTLNLVGPEETTTGQLGRYLRDMFGFDIMFDETKPEGPSMAYMSSLRAIRQVGWNPRSVHDGIRALAEEVKKEFQTPKA